MMASSHLHSCLFLSTINFTHELNTSNSKKRKPQSCAPRFTPYFSPTIKEPQLPLETGRLDDWITAPCVLEPRAGVAVKEMPWLWDLSPSWETSWMWNWGIFPFLFASLSFSSLADRILARTGQLWWYSFCLLSLLASPIQNSALSFFWLFTKPALRNGIKESGDSLTTHKILV